MSRGSQAGVIGGLLGVAAAGAAAGLTAERYLIGRSRGRPDPEAREAFGRLPGRTRHVLADDGVALHVEEVGPDAPAFTVVFAHGYANTLGVWHYQRRDLADGLPQPTKLVFYDQRAHGRSGSAPAQTCTVDQLGRDLATVVTAVAPDGPVALVGHSMGGMAVMALAEQRPELFADRVVAIALIATSSGGLREVSMGLPAVLSRASHRLLPVASGLLSRNAALVERGRRVGSDLSWLVTRHSGFGSRDVSPALVDLVESMQAATPVDVLTAYYPSLMSHDRVAALVALGNVPTLVIVGDRDVLCPPEHSRKIAEAVPGAQLLVVEGAGHMVALERPGLVTFHLRALLAQASAAAPSRR